MTHHTAHVSDEAARRLAQTEFDHPVAVEAGAGTGKTTVLVARVLAWCLGHGWKPAQERLWEGSGNDPTDDEIAAQVLNGLVAITFTEAAAAQMARRVAEALARVAAEPPASVVGFHPELLPESDPSLLKARARALLGTLDHLAVRTIHSHCWHLLTTYPMAAGLSPDLQVDADGRRLEELIREVVETATKKAYIGPSSHPLYRLALRGVDPRKIAAAVFQLVNDGFPAAALKGDPLSPARRSRIRRELSQRVAAVQHSTLPLKTQNRAKKDRQTAEAVDQTATLLSAAAPTELDLDDLAGLLGRLRDIWPDDLIERLGSWSQGGFTKTVTDLLEDNPAHLSKTATALVRSLRLYRRLDIEILDCGRRALEPLISTVEEELKARGIVTYSSLMTEAWKLLKDHPPALRNERRRLQQLMVDEFQDTDRLQCDLVRFLALGGKESERPGLFVVGDPKQSIYGWRDADLEAYENFLEDLQAARGICVELNQNFRSVPAVLEEVDRALGPIMLAEPGMQPAFARLLPCEKLSTDPGFQAAERAAVEYWVSWTDAGDATKAGDAALQEANSIAHDIRMLHDQQGVPWNDFGLLLRSTSRLETYLDAFRQAAVPFVVTSDKHYFRRREIIEAAALVRAVIVPVDHLALVAFLRSATVGVPDVALLPLWQRRFPELVARLENPESPELEQLRSILDEVAAAGPEEIPGLEEIRGWHTSAAAALENLAHLRMAFAREPADRFINELRQRLLFDITESARHLGVYRLANLDRFFRELETALEEQDGDIQGVLRALRRSVTERQEAEQALPEGATEEAVQVMTIHGAKGLEFGHVYLPQLHAKGRQNPAPAVAADRRWLPGKQAEYILFDSPTPGFDQVEERRARVERTERIRTLYVAMTRAKSRLVLLGNWPDSTAPVAEEKRLTYLDLLRERASLPESMTALAESCSDTDDGFVDLGEARWRFPYLGAGSGQALKKRPAKSGLPTIKVVKQQAARLQTLAESARHRMGRQFSGAASAEAAERLARAATDEPGFETASLARDIAMPVGSAFHRMMETWDLQADPDLELSRQSAIQIQWLTGTLAAEQVASGLDHFAALLERFSKGRFLRRFADLESSHLAREVPIVIPPSDPDSGPVGFLTGFIDLVYQDPATQRWIIVDYKTDRLKERADIEARARAYGLQEAVYARALQQSMSLDDLPAAELWFIWPDILWQDSGAL